MNDLQRVAAEGLVAVRQYLEDGTVPAGGQWAVDLIDRRASTELISEYKYWFRYHADGFGREDVLARHPIDQKVFTALEAKVANDRIRPRGVEVPESL